MMMMKTKGRFLFPSFCYLWWLFGSSNFGIVGVHANVKISEVAPAGTSNACNGEDWVELSNVGSDEEFDMTGYLLTDDKGFDSPDSEPYYFPSGFTLQSNQYLVLCGGKELNTVPIPMNSDGGNGTTTTTTTTSGSISLLPIPFGIGNDDTIQLILLQEQQPQTSDGTTTTSTVVQVQSVAGPFPPNPNPQVKDVTYAWDEASQSYNYTSTPTPGNANIMTPIPTKEELDDEKKQMLAIQNDKGIEFFNLDRQGMPTSSPSAISAAVLDLKITMEPTDWNSIQQNPQYMEYAPFTSATISASTTTGEETLLQLNDPGRIRTRGNQATYMSSCLGSPLPFRLDFDSTNKTQTLFGVQRIYLRHPLPFDQSYTREWAYSRMLARYGLPHARTRMIQFYINDEFQGLYTLMEHPDEEYVFARNFPDHWDPSNYALFQTTPFTENCGRYPQELVQEATTRVDESSTPPYAFERGDHNTKVTNLGQDKLEECKVAYQEYHNKVLMEDVVLAYLRHDMICEDVFLKEGLLDQELGSNKWDKEIKQYIQDYMAFQPSCDPDCTNSNLANDVDLENFLKTFAFYAVALVIDSPLSNTNNYYLAQQSNQDKKWKLMAFDFDQPGTGMTGCHHHEDVCNSRLIHWSITRPTCEALESNSLVGPLLSNTTLQSQYLGYVKDFLDIYSDAAFMEEIQTQINALAESGTIELSEEELAPDAASWDSGNFPLLATMKARAEDVQKQLAALDDGTYPRSSSSSSSSSGEAWEPCADWRMSEPDTSACEGGCKSDGCIMEGWTVESYCDEATGKCYHGNEDVGCAGVADGDTYEGMDSGTFCRFAAGIPTKTSECGVVDLTETDSSDTTSKADRRTPILSGLSFCFVAWSYLSGLL